MPILFSMCLAGEFPELSPFSGVRWSQDRAEVRLEESWYRPITMEGVPVEEVLTFCREQYGRKWKKRFGEDLCQVFAEMGKAISGKTIDLELEPLDGGKTLRIKTTMTNDNRIKIRDANRKTTSSRPIGKKLSPDQVRADLAQVWRGLTRHQSYLQRDKNVLNVAFAGLIESSLEKTPSRLARDLTHLLARLGDGHTRVKGRSRYLPRGYAAACFETVPEGFLVLDVTGQKLLNADYPYLVAMDGLKLDVWLSALQPYVTAGSASLKMVERQALLANVALGRWELGLPKKATINLTLADENGDTENLEVAQVRVRPRRRHRSYKEAQLLGGNIGYLPIARMDKSPDFQQMLHAAMASFKNSSGLIIDVRGNPGGNRLPLLTLADYFLDEGQMVVANVAFFRTDGPDRPDGYLADRYLYPLSASIWNGEQRRFLKNFLTSFQPEWQPPAKKFSIAHLMLLQGQAKVPRYTQPVVVLMDEGCYSASDIFLAGMKAIPGATLLGTVSGGGSGRAQHQVTLKNSGILIGMSTMASFAPDGRLYDGNGVQPDQLVSRPWTDFRDGVDSQLNRALALFVSADAGLK